MLTSFRGTLWFLGCATLCVACGQVSEIGDGSSGGTGGFIGSQGGSGQGGSAQGGSGQGGSGQGGLAQGGSGQGGSAQGGTSFGGAGNAGAGGFSDGGTSWGGVGGVGGSITVLGEGFVGRDFKLGDLTPSGVPSSSAWQRYGLDLDGLASTKDSTDHCQPQPGSNPSAVKADGPDGLDNSFGKNVLPILLGVAPTLSDDMQQRVDQGKSVAFITGHNIAVSDLVGSIGRAHASGNSYNLQEPWRVFENGYPNGTPRCSLVGGTFQGQLELAGSGFWELHLPIADNALVVRVRQTQVRADVDPVSGEPSNVILAGVIRTEEFVEAFRQVAGALDTSLCAGATFDSIAAQLRAASDIRDDARNGDPQQLCNGISIGIGVELDRMAFLGYDSGDTPATTCF
ncbi:MAG: hypothetical protein KC766_34275 [Myxococcales bacterium]|nr:hypothetical protein [Myxococcales bacterium]